MDKDQVSAQLTRLMDGPIGYYRLEGHDVVRCYEWLPWALGQDDPTRQVADDRGDGWRLSTVFLGLATLREGRPPDLFETMLFPTDEGPRMLARYPTWEAALHGHRVWLGKVALVLAGDGPLWTRAPA